MPPTSSRRWFIPLYMISFGRVALRRLMRDLRSTRWACAMCAAHEPLLLAYFFSAHEQPGKARPLTEALARDCTPEDMTGRCATLVAAGHKHAFTPSQYFALSGSATGRSCVAVVTICHHGRLYELATIRRCRCQSYWPFKFPFLLLDTGIP